MAALLPEPVADLRGHVALYGGSFDPPHMGHQLACLYLLEALGADAVWLVPTGRHAFGKLLTPPPVRLPLLAELAAPLGPRVRVEPIETEHDEESRSWRTLERLRARHPQFRFALAVGADVYAELPRWQHAQALLAQTPVALLGRAGVPPPPLPAGRPYVALPDIESRRLRQRLAEGQGVRGLVPAAVAEAIEAAGLYRQGGNP